jgi:RNA polymerase sigma-70 factor (ECF subfamily)
MAQPAAAWRQPTPAPVAPVDEAAGALGAAARLRPLFDAHFSFVWRNLRRLGLAHADADDAAQQVFLVLARKLESIEPGKERSYLYGVSLRVVGEVRRARRRRHEVPDDSTGDAADPRERPDANADREQARALLDCVLDQMDLKLRSVFVLFELEELATAEIAELLELPTGTVASRLRRARESFHAIVKRMRAAGQLPGEKP